MNILLILLGIGLFCWLIQVIFYMVIFIFHLLWTLVEHIIGGLYCLILGMIEGIVSTINSLHKVFIRLIKEAFHSIGFIDYLRECLLLKGIGYIYGARGNFIDIEKVAERARHCEYVGRDYLLNCFEVGRSIICGSLGAFLGLVIGIITCSISFSTICVIYLVSCIMTLLFGIGLGIKNYLQSMRFKSLMTTYHSLFKDYNKDISVLKLNKQDRILPIIRGAIRFNTRLHKLITEIVFFMIHIILFIATLPFNLSFFVIIKLGYVLKRKLIKYSTVCPSCYEEMKIPNSMCPQCGEVHNKMWPHFKYVLYKKCTCGKRIWVDNWLRRRKGLGSCNHCETKLLKMDYIPMHIPIIGTSQVGKTNFIYSMLEDYEDTLGFDEEQFRDYLNYMKIVKEEVKNTLSKPKDHFNLYFKKSIGRASMVFLHELSSESSLDSNQLDQIKWLSHSKGLIMLFKLDDDSQKPEEILDIFLIYMHKFCALKPHQRIKKLCTFVLRIKGDQLADRTLSGEELLKQAGCHSLLSKIQSKFKRYRFVIEPDYNWDNNEEYTREQRKNALEWIIDN